MKLYCCKCKKMMDCELVKGNVIYPRRLDLANHNFYRCSCGCFVGCHPNTDKPLGAIPTEEMKKARMIIHGMIDPWWQKGVITRGAMYRAIAKELHIKEYHTGWTRSIEQCRQVYRAASAVIKRLENRI